VAPEPPKIVRLDDRWHLLRGTVGTEWAFLAGPLIHTDPARARELPRDDAAFRKLVGPSA
jgi:hypothetical protein